MSRSLFMVLRSTILLNARDILNAELDNYSALGAIRLALNNQTYTLVQADEVNVTPCALCARLKALKGSDTGSVLFRCPRVRQLQA